MRVERPAGVHAEHATMHTRRDSAAPLVLVGPAPPPPADWLPSGCAEENELSRPVSPASAGGENR